MSRSEDLRFTVLEDAAALVQMLPPDAEEIAWPSDQGDVKAVAEALAVLSARLPAVKASFRRHRRELRASSSRSRALELAGGRPV